MHRYSQKHQPRYRSPINDHHKNCPKASKNLPNLRQLSNSHCQQQQPLTTTITTAGFDRPCTNEIARAESSARGAQLLTSARTLNCRPRDSAVCTAATSLSLSLALSLLLSYRATLLSTCLAISRTLTSPAPSLSVFVLLRERNCSASALLPSSFSTCILPPPPPEREREIPPLSLILFPAATFSSSSSSSFSLPFLFATNV